MSEEARGAVRRSGENLLCREKIVGCPPVVGLTESDWRTRCAWCFDALGYHKTYKDCCVQQEVPFAR